MGIELSEQLNQFLAAGLLGVGLGVLFDLFRIFRLIFPMPKLMSLCVDILYGMIAGVLSFLLFLYTMSGQLRFFALTGELSGFVLYHLTLGRLVLMAGEFLARHLRRFGRLCREIFVDPLCEAGTAAVRWARAEQKKAREKRKKEAIRRKMDLQRQKRMVYNLAAQGEQPPRPRRKGKRHPHGSTGKREKGEYSA